MVKIIHLVLGTIIILFGVFLWNNPMDSLAAYCYYIGFTYFISATLILIASLFNKQMPTPWTSIIWDYIIALIILFYPKISLFFFLWLFIFGYLAIAGIYLYIVWHKRRMISWHLTKIALAIIGIICGIAMLVNPLIGFATLAKLIAIAVMLSGFGYALPALIPQRL